MKYYKSSKSVTIEFAKGRSFSSISTNARPTTELSDDLRQKASDALTYTPTKLPPFTNVDNLLASPVTNEPIDINLFQPYNFTVGGGITYNNTNLFSNYQGQRFKSNKFWQGSIENIVVSNQDLTWNQVWSQSFT